MTQNRLSACTTYLIVYVYIADTCTTQLTNYMVQQALNRLMQILIQ